MSLPSISPGEAHARVARGDNVCLLDVRTPAEHRTVHAVGARNLPLDQLDAAKCRELAGELRDSTALLLCKSGQRASIACEKLANAGLHCAFIVEGGTDAWAAAGLPVERGKATMDLERQVRIAAGSLVTAGILCSWFVHPYFIGLSLFVGCGLVFAGVTNTCAMGMLLSRAPWNRA